VADLLRPTPAPQVCPVQGSHGAQIVGVQVDQQMLTDEVRTCLKDTPVLVDALH
jgi:hypothetical protein